MEIENISNAVVVGHSVAGVWLQLLLGQAADRISRLVFLDAVILKNGESFVSNAVGPAQVSPTLLTSPEDFSGRLHVLGRSSSESREIGKPSGQDVSYFRARQG
jgi:pimeloyl-ACP methyl ester carboxylesterase